MSLFCSICGSGSAWEDGWVAAEGEEGEGDEGFGSVKAEGDAGEEPDLGVGGLARSWPVSTSRCSRSCRAPRILDLGRDDGELVCRDTHVLTSRCGTRSAKCASHCRSRSATIPPSADHAPMAARRGACHRSRVAEPRLRRGHPTPDARHARRLEHDRRRQPVATSTARLRLSRSFRTPNARSSTCGAGGNQVVRVHGPRHAW